MKLFVAFHWPCAVQWTRSSRSIDVVRLLDRRRQRRMLL